MQAGIAFEIWSKIEVSQYVIVFAESYSHDASRSLDIALTPICFWIAMNARGFTIC